MGIIGNLAIRDKIQKNLDLLYYQNDRGQKALLFKLTTFPGRDGEIIQGKSSINVLSDRQAEIVLEKLERLVEQEGKFADYFKITDYEKEQRIEKRKMKIKELKLSITIHERWIKVYQSAKDNIIHMNDCEAVGLLYCNEGGK